MNRVGTLAGGQLAQERLTRRRVLENLWHVMKPFSKGICELQYASSLGHVWGVQHVCWWAWRQMAQSLMDILQLSASSFAHPLVAAGPGLLCRWWVPIPREGTGNSSPLLYAAQHLLLLFHTFCAWRAWFGFPSVLQLLQGWSPVLGPLRSGSLRDSMCAPTAAGSWNGPCTLLSVHSKELLVRRPAWTLLFNSLVIPIYVKSKYFFTFCINYKLHFLWQYQKGCCFLGNITGLKGLCAALFLERCI